MSSFGLYILAGLESQQLWMRKNFPKVYDIFNLTNAAMVSLPRLISGKFTAYDIDKCAKPENPLIIYEFEGCPFCKLVREALCVLDIDYIVYPCPRSTIKASGIIGESKFRQVVKEKGGKLMFPYMEDPNTGKTMYESQDIIKYLWETYGAKATPSIGYKLAHSWFFMKLSFASISFARPCQDMGYVLIKSKTPEKLLELWGYESSPPVKIVREILCSLEIPYIMHTMPYGSSSRQKFYDNHHEQISSTRKALGMLQVPFLKDPNTGVEMFESLDIVKYLKNTYQIGDYPKESWLDYGKGVTEASKTDTS